MSIKILDEMGRSGGDTLSKITIGDKFMRVVFALIFMFIKICETSTLLFSFPFKSFYVEAFVLV